MANDSRVWVEHLCQAGIWAARAALAEIDDYINSYPEEAFETIRIGKRQKKALAVDRSAERIFKKTLKTYHHKMFQRVEVIGEESLSDGDLDLSNSHKDSVFALVDMIDGTDLLERGMCEWCATGVFFKPRGRKNQKILAAFVATPAREIYYATTSSKNVRVVSLNRKRTDRSVGGPSKNKDLSEASVCFYGQKASSLSSVFLKDNSDRSRVCFLDRIIQLDAKQKEKRNDRLKKGRALSAHTENKGFRIYNLAGIPMMMKLIDQRINVAKNIDIVFDIRGQKPHDVVPGAWLAMKAGAKMKQFMIQDAKTSKVRVVTAREMTYAALEESLMRPASPQSDLRYVISANTELSSKIEPWLLALVRQQETPSGPV